MLAASVVAQTSGFDVITSPTEGEVATVGSTLNIIWTDSVQTSPITITLLYGESQSTLQLGDAIATSIESSLGTYAWNIPASVAGYSTYGFKLSLDSDPSTFQYSFPFKITGSSSSSMASSSVASAGTSIASVAAAVSTPALIASTTVAPALASTLVPTQAAPFPTIVPTNTTSNSSWAPASTGLVPTATSTVISSNSAYRDVAVRGLSLIAAFGFTAAFLL